MIFNLWKSDSPFINRIVFDNTRVKKTRKFSNFIKVNNEGLFEVLLNCFSHEILKISNLYFFFIGLLQTIPSLTVTYGYPIMWVPWILLIFLSVFLDMVYAYRRIKLGKLENKRTAKRLIIENNELYTKQVTWGELYVGDIVFLKNRDYVPADLLIIKSSSPEVFIDASNLDGEANYKSACVPEQIANFDLLKYLKEDNLQGFIVLHPPDADYRHLTGHCSFTIPDLETSIDFLRTPENILLRGSQIVYTSWVIGIIMYAGSSTKMYNRITNIPRKSSLVEKDTNSLILISFCSMMWICMFLTILPYLIYQIRAKHLFMKTKVTTTFFTWLLMIVNIVPISLFFFLRITRTLQAVSLEKEETTNKKKEIKVFNPALNSDLGQVQYIFTDKTGTLTSNYMNIQALCISAEEYTSVISSFSNFSRHSNDMLTELGTPHVLLESTELRSAIENKDLNVWDFFIHICSNNTALPIRGNSQRVLFASTNYDELALLYFAQHYKFTLNKRSKNYIEVILPNSNILKVDIWANSKFTYEKKKSSAVVRYICPLLNKERIVFLFKAPLYNMAKCKGVHKSTINRYGESFGKQMMRVMGMGTKEISEEAFSDWLFKFKEAKLESNQATIDSLIEELENQSIAQGCVGIGSDIMSDVDNTVTMLKLAGIKLCMLTGDDFDVSIQTGLKTQLIPTSDGTTIIQIDKPGYAHEQLQLIYENLKMNKMRSEMCLVIDGTCLQNIIYLDSRLIVNLFNMVEGFIVCRATPFQKALLINRINQASLEKSITLAIGDGANDCAMLNAALVGVGIFSDTDNSALSVSDFGVRSFNNLIPLLLIHGRFNYRRIAILTQYSLSKMFIIDIPQLMTALFNIFRPQSVIGENMIQLTNPLYSFFAPIIFGVFDSDLPKKIVLKNPELYKDGINQKLLNVSKYIEDVSYSFIQGFIAGIIPIIVFGFNIVDNSGRTVGLSNFSTTSFFCSIFLMTQRLNFECVSTLTIIIVINFFSVSSFFPTLFIFSSLRDSAYQLFTSPSFYAAWLLTFCLGLFQDYVRNSYRRLKKPTLVDKLQAEVDSSSRSF